LARGGDALSGVYMFSSGSTGKSKRVTRTQEQLVLECDALRERLELGAQDRILCTVPLFHAHGFCNAMLAALLNGGALILPEGEFNPRATAKLLCDQAVTVYPAVPFLLQLLTETQFDAALDLSALRWAISAGVALPQTVAEQFSSRFGKPVHQLYGTTETGVIAVQAPAVTKPESVGQPLAGTQIVIRDEQGAALPVGQQGEVWVSAASATKAYDGLPEMTARCFDGNWFGTGDLGYLDQDGDLFITGRTKLVINVAGLKVDPLEIEAVLKLHPAVADVVVLGVPHGALGEKVKAAVVLAEGRHCSEQELLAHAGARLADYKLPKLIEFITEIPRSALGKVLRKDL
jgi:long-chain acyl-CoA synthetase